MPADLPVPAFSALDVNPELGINLARSQGGLVITSRRSDPFWRGIITTPDLDPRGDNERAAFLAWLNWAVDLNMRVDMVHPRHRLPRSYTDATWPMIGNGSIVSVPDLRTPRVSGLPVGLILKAGDRVSFLQGDLIIHRMIAQDLVVTSELSQAVSVTPRLPIGVLVAGAAVVLKNPKLRFIIVPGSWADTAKEEPEATPISFEAAEALR